MALRRIDLASRSCVADLRSVCGGHGAGFFYLRMSAAESSAAAAALDATRSFFELPSDKKRALAVGPESFYRFRGLTIPGSGPGYRAPSEDPNFALDRRESFNIGRECAADAEPPYGPSQWPSEADAPGMRTSYAAYAALLWQRRSAWCHTPRPVHSPFRTTCCSVSRCRLRCSRQLCGALAQALDMPADHFNQPGLFDRPTWLLGAVHYLPQPSVPERGQFGIAPHQARPIVAIHAAPRGATPYQGRVLIITCARSSGRRHLHAPAH